MFDFVQKNTLFIKVILGAVALTFVGFGVGSYSAVMEEPYLAKVGDERITTRDIEHMLSGRAADDATRRQILESFIQQRLVLVDAKEAGLVVTPERLRQAIAQVPAFQDDGKFSSTLYQNYLQSRRLDAAAFEDEIRAELLLQMQIEALGSTGFVAEHSLKHLGQLLAEIRHVQPMILQPEQYLSKVHIDDASIKKFYDTETSRFIEPEAVKINYVEINLDDIARNISIADTELRQYFEDNREEFAREERELAHILLTISPNANAQERQATRDKITAIRQQITNNPDKFTELAQQYSQDPGSKANGGNLGKVSRGVMVKAFEDAAFSLKQGELSDIVETQFGLHLIRVNAIERPDFAAVKDDILTRLQRQQANRQYRQKIEELGEIAYQNPSNLDKVTAALSGAQVQHSDWILRNENAAESPLAHPKMLEAIFSDDALKNKNNTEAIEIANGRTIIARVAEHRPQSRQAFEQVKRSIRQELALKAAADLAQKDGERLLAELKQGQNPSLEWEPVMRISRMQPQGLNPSQLSLVYAVPSAHVGKAAGHVGARLPNGAFAIYRVSQISSAPDRDKLKTELASYVNEIYAADETVAYIASLYRKIPVKLGQFENEN